MVRTEGEECSKPYDRIAPIVGGCNDPGFSLCREKWPDCWMGDVYGESRAL
jgi:hypothetical protein